ncbi:hypothetical protein PSENEW3n2_00000853 [Picochlorum sp. SENEW3]|nr:hypothetical protein PSENEW3n2_00000853 [Picochlorum sp. SENEW3]WPT15775.1 hypothetical protein PSENEW3_00000853 [Picochlorum sp. SENEW3]
MEQQVKILEIICTVILHIGLQPSSRIFRKRRERLGLSHADVEDLQAKTVAKQVKEALSRECRSTSTAAAGGHYFAYNMLNTKTYLKISTHRATPVDMHRLLRTGFNVWSGLLYRFNVSMAQSVPLARI